MFGSEGSRADSAAKGRAGGQRENPLLAFGSEADPTPPSWAAASARSGAERLAELSWSADKAVRSARDRIVGRALVPALVLGCLLLGSFLFAQEMLTKIVPTDVPHPDWHLSAGFLRPVPAPPPTETLHPHVPAVPATPAAAMKAERPMPARAAVPLKAPSEAVVRQTARPIRSPGLGLLSINATPWADVWIDGQWAGQTPIANLTVAIGGHDVLFRHPQLGERRQTVVVNDQGTARLSTDFRTR